MGLAIEGDKRQLAIDRHCEPRLEQIVAVPAKQLHDLDGVGSASALIMELYTQIDRELVSVIGLAGAWQLMAEAQHGRVDTDRSADESVVNVGPDIER
jgi:hypothetical protein